MIPTSVFILRVSEYFWLFLESCFRQKPIILPDLQDMNGKLTKFSLQITNEWNMNIATYKYCFSQKMKCKFIRFFSCSVTY